MTGGKRIRAEMMPEEALNRWVEMNELHQLTALSNIEKEARKLVSKELVNELKLLEAAEIARDFGCQGSPYSSTDNPKTQ